MTTYREPTADECSAHTVVQVTDTMRGYACWYPRMGGYSGKAVALVPDDEGCVDLLVWHNGEFPFQGQDHWGGVNNPVEVHHCDPDQFVGFGQWLDGLEPLR